ncbi:hypothetical protein [Roseovarius sp.]|jgi:hypothetical protein
MDPDLALILGLVLIVLSIPSMVAALSDGHAPRVAAIILIAGGAMVVWAITTKPGGYTIHDVPDTFIKVVGRYLA